MNILFAASEVAPFVKTGGLADVIGSLPKELKRMGVDVRVILPKYGEIADDFKQRMRTVHTFTLALGWRNQYCGIQHLQYEGIDFYLIDNEYYFNRKSLYGYDDDAERFVFFSRAVLEALPHLDFRTDLLHCHDWQTGLIPFILSMKLTLHPFYMKIKTVYTIHNLKYQGIFPWSLLKDYLNMNDEEIANIEFYGQVNCMKAGIQFADTITTVSPSYAKEIQSPHYGEQLDGLLRARSAKLHGILNGIDNQLFDPMTDPQLAVHYRNSLSKKRSNKTELQHEFGLPVDPDIPMIGMVSRLVAQKGLDLVVRMLDEILRLNVQLVILGTGERKYELIFADATRRYPQKISAHITFNDSLSRKIYAASDLFLMPSQFEPCGIGQLLALRYRSVPIVRETGGLKDTVRAFDEFTGEGNGFSFEHYNAHDMLHTIRRAVGLYHDSEKWRQIIKNISQSDFSWTNSAKKYIELYQNLLSTDLLS